MPDNKLIFEYDRDSGGVSSIMISGDKYGMNWCESRTAVWGVPYHNAQVSFNRFDQLKLETFSDGKSVYGNVLARVTVVRTVTERGEILEEYEFENVSSSPLFVGKGEFGIFTPFNDNYDFAEYCLTNKCHTHIYTGGNTAWVRALRMGENGYDLGLVLTRGAIDCYRQWLPPYAKNDRGDLMLCTAPFELLPGEKYKLSWTLFAFSSGENDGFDARRHEIAPEKLDIAFENDTLFNGEKLVVSLYSKRNDLKDSFCTVNGREARSAGVDRSGNAVFEFSPDGPGELTVKARCGNETVAGKAFVSPELDKLIEARIAFICRKQQFFRTGHPLDGAYLIYDNDFDSMYFSNNVADHNASRERIGMGILVAKYLRERYSEEFDRSLREYESFVFREFVDPETGDVFDTVGRDPSQIRLYNAPWVCVFACELYKLRKDKRYLDIASRVMEKYYSGGGDHFYPNAFSAAEPIELMREAGMTAEANRVLESVLRHCENIIAKGTDYPKHEVDYEQTIVAPALTFLLQAYRLTGERRYLDESGKHLSLLTRFNGTQPDYRLNETAIRHWDDFWFGKSAAFGDTFPHYWSVLSGWCFYLYYKATGDEVYLRKAQRSARNCLCLFKPDGRASCAYVYPFKINDKHGEFFDAWANDQDFALYFAMKILKGE